MSNLLFTKGFYLKNNLGYMMLLVCFFATINVANRADFVTKIVT